VVADGGRGQLLRSVWICQAPLGFNPSMLRSVQFWLPTPNYPKTDIYGTAAQMAVLARELLRLSRLLPGSVRRRPLGSDPSIPLHHDANRSRWIVEGTPDQITQTPLVERSKVTGRNIFICLLGDSVLRAVCSRRGDNEECAGGSP